LITSLFCSILGCAPQPDTPEAFIARFKDIFASADAKRVLPELVLSRTEFQEYSNSFFQMHPDYPYNLRQDNGKDYKWERMQHEYSEQILDNRGWPKYWVDLDVDSIKTDTVIHAIAPGMKPHLPTVNEKYILAFGRLKVFPDLKNINVQIRCQCAKVRNGKWGLCDRFEIQTIE
jgi:hypothetical protein